MNVQIEVFRPEHAGAFARINREWLEQAGILEPSDEAQLAAPRAHFVDCGGQILVALHDGNVIGTCAAVPQLALDPTEPEA